MERDAVVLAGLDTMDNGKPYAVAVEDVQSSVDCFRYFAGWSDKIHGDTIPGIYTTAFPINTHYFLLK